MRLLQNKVKLSVLTALFLILGVSSSYADEVSLIAQAPKTVVQGERFTVSFTVNTRKAEGFRAPSMDGLSVLSGPNTSSSTSFTSINGKSTQSTTIKYSYIVMANAEGEVSIGPATITAEKQHIQSNSLIIKVLPPDTPNRTQGSAQGNVAQGNVAQSSGDDIFMLATVDRKSVYEQEALLLTYKLYVAPSVSLEDVRGKMPDLKNCHVQEVELPQRKEFQLEHYNGRNYRTLVYCQYVLFPQQSGKLEIPAVDFEGIIEIPIESDDMFDFFFNTRYQQVRKTLVAGKIEVDVKPLPLGKSNVFYGGVGDFSISSSVNSTEVTANDAVTLRVVLSGTGNLKLVKTPQIKFPQDFDVYDPKVENKYSLKNGRQTGNKVFEYLVIPRHAGQYVIPPVEFQYFDTGSGEYRTIKTDEYQLNVAKGQGGEQPVSVSAYVSKEELKYVGQDVRFHSTPARLDYNDGLLFGTPLFYLLLAIPPVILLCVVMARRKRMHDNANQTVIRVKKAGTAASKRLKKAAKLMKAGQKEQFYDEMMRAISGYLGDRLAIPVAELSKDNIRAALEKRGTQTDLVQTILHLLDDCEFVRFAPGDDNGRMDRLYEEASETIGKIESSLS